MITGTGTSWSSLCPGGATPCKPTNLYFEFTGEVVNGVHLVMPVATISSDTSATLTLVNQGGNVPYGGYISSGAYKIYQGSSITSVPYTSGVFTAPQATVTDASQFRAGDSVMEVGASAVRHTGMYNVMLNKNIPTPANARDSIYGGTSAGNFPVGRGVVFSGLFGWDLFEGTWQTKGTAPNYGVYLSGVQPAQAFIFAGDPANNNLERLLETQTSSGSNVYLGFDRTNGNNWWNLGNFHVSTDRRISINSVPQAGITAYFGISSGDSLTQEGLDVAYGATPNNNVTCASVDISGVASFRLRSDGTRCNGLYNNGASLTFYSDNLSTPQATINGTNGQAAFKHLNQTSGHDVAGTIAVSSATSASANFTTPFNNAPICTLTPTSDPTGVGAWWVTTTNSCDNGQREERRDDRFNYVCAGNPN